MGVPRERVATGDTAGVSCAGPFESGSQGRFLRLAFRQINARAVCKGFLSTADGRAEDPKHGKKKTKKADRRKSCLRDACVRSGLLFSSRPFLFPAAGPVGRPPLAGDAPARTTKAGAPAAKSTRENAPAKAKASSLKPKPGDAKALGSSVAGSKSKRAGKVPTADTVGRHDDARRSKSKSKAAGKVPTADTAGHHGDAGKGGGCVSRWHARITRKGDEFFYKLGHLVAHGPKMTLFIAFLCVFLCTFGFVNFRTESDCE